MQADHKSLQSAKTALHEANDELKADKDALEKANKQLAVSQKPSLAVCLIDASLCRLIRKHWRVHVPKPVMKRLNRCNRSSMRRIRK